MGMDNKSDRRDRRHKEYFPNFFLKKVKYQNYKFNIYISKIERRKKNILK